MCREHNHFCTTLTEPCALPLLSARGTDITVLMNARHSTGGSCLHRSERSQCRTSWFACMLRFKRSICERDEPLISIVNNDTIAMVSIKNCKNTQSLFIMVHISGTLPKLCKSMCANAMSVTLQQQRRAMNQVDLFRTFGLQRVSHLRSPNANVLATGFGLHE